MVKSAGIQVRPKVTRKHAGEELTDASGERKLRSARFPDVPCDSAVQMKPTAPLYSLEGEGQFLWWYSPQKMHARKEVQLSHHNNNMQSTIELWNIRLNKTSVDTGGEKGPASFMPR